MDDHGVEAGASAAMRTRRNLTRVACLACLLVAALVLTACGSGDSSSESDGGGSPASAGGSAQDSLRAIQSVPPSGFNVIIGIEAPTFRISKMVVEMATAYIPEGDEYRVEAGLVEEWEQTAPKRWQFKVRPDVTFTNGEPLTSEAFAVAFKDIIDHPESDVNPFFKDFSLKVVDEMTFEINTPVPDYALLLGRMSFLPAVPPEYYAEVGPETFNEKPIGTGPYVVKEFVPGRSATLEANPEYWGGAPAIKTLSFDGVPDASTRVSELTSGGADIIDLIPPSLTSVVEGSDGVEARQQPSLRRVALAFNMLKEPFDDVRIRQAINYAIDDDTIIEELYQGVARPLDGVFVPGELGHSEDFNPYPYDPDKARSLLAEAGHENGLSADFYFSVGYYTLDRELAEVVQAQLKEVGINLKMRAGEWSTQFDAFTSGERSGMLLIPPGPQYPDSDFVTSVFLSGAGSFAEVVDADEITELADKGRSTVDQDARLEIYTDIQKVAIEDLAMWAPILQLVDVWGIDEKLDWETRSDQRYELQLAKFTG